MRQILRFLFENPIVLLALATWILGLVATTVRNVKKAQAARREREQRTTQLPTMRAPAPAAEPQARTGALRARTAEEVAAEMRRILGMEPEAVEEPRARRPAPEPARRTGSDVERPPAPVRPTTQTRRLEVHVDPHVGERIEQRHAPQSGRVGQRDQAHALGSLGGRVGAGPARRRAAARLVGLDDLKRVFVASEILGPPLALRSLGEGRG